MKAGMWLVKGKKKTLDDHMNIKKKKKVSNKSDVSENLGVLIDLPHNVTKHVLQLCLRFPGLRSGHSEGALLG